MNALDEVIDKLIVSIAKTMENPPADLAHLIESTDTPEDTSDKPIDSGSPVVGVELQALIDVVMNE